ncbi:MAG: hypothetical protein ACOC0J_01385, partial [Myxococcota bacterium]
MWVQALNPFEYQEAQQRAAAARSRFAMAIKEIGSPDYENFQGMLVEMDDDEKRERIVQLELGKKARDIAFNLAEDEDWLEVRNLLDRAEELLEGSEEERELVAKKTKEYSEELDRRVEEERDYLTQKWASMPPEKLDDYLRDFWIDLRGGEKAVLEYELLECFYGCRVCEATQDDEGQWHHDGCDHSERAFETVDELRVLPKGMWDEIRLGFETVNMEPREAGNSDRLGSSSASSPPPSEAEASQPSSQPETSEAAPGTSPTPSPTP